MAGLIILAGAGFRITDAVRKQYTAPDVVIPPALLDETLKIIASLDAGELVPDVSQALYVQFRPSVQPYLISWFKYDPVAELAKVTAPAIVIQGTTDMQISMDNAERLAAARPGIPLIRIEGMNHILKNAPKDRTENFATYTKPLLPLSPRLMPPILKFLRQQPTSQRDPLTTR